MNAGYFIAIVLISGFAAGTIHGAVNLVIVEPYLDEAIGIENQNLFTSCLLYTSPSPRDATLSRMPSSA